MKICVAFLVSLGFGLGCVSNANAQSACPPPSTSPSMTIKIFNDEPSGGRYIFPVFTTGAPGPSDRLQAWFCVNAAYTRTLLRRIYINPTSGIAPGQSVTLQIPLYTQIVASPNPSLPDQYIDWWTGDTIELFFNTTNTTPDALKDELDDRTGGCGKGGECQTSLATGPGFPTCVGCAADGLQFFSDTASIGKSDPSQLIEFNLGALQLIAGRSPLLSRLRKPAPRNTKAKARTSAISQNPNARKPAVIRINRSARASRTWVRADGEKA